MNRLLIPVVMLVVVVSFFVGTIASRSRAQPVAGQQWEYLTVERTGRLYQFDSEAGEFINLLSIEDKITDIKYAGRNNNGKLTILLANVGAAGWELSAVDGDVLIFKRPKAAG